MRLKRREENKVSIPSLQTFASNYVDLNSLASIIPSLYSCNLNSAATTVPRTARLSFDSTPRESRWKNPRGRFFLFIHPDRGTGACPFNVARFSSPRTTFSCRGHRENVCGCGYKRIRPSCPGADAYISVRTVSGDCRVTSNRVPTSGKKGRAALFRASAALISRETGIFKFQMDVFAETENAVRFLNESGMNIRREWSLKWSISFLLVRFMISIMIVFLTTRIIELTWKLYHTDSNREFFENNYNLYTLLLFQNTSRVSNFSWKIESHYKKKRRKIPRIVNLNFFQDRENEEKNSIQWSRIFSPPFKNPPVSVKVCP